MYLCTENKTVRRYYMNSFHSLNYHNIETPCYVVEEKLLRANLARIKEVQEKAPVTIILAFKAYALWKTFPIIREYIPYSTASSLSEARLAYEEMGSKAHTYAPVYTAKEFPEIARLSSHITFNSIAQYQKYQTQARAQNVSCGLRINPEFSHVETDLYNPCAPGSRLGISIDEMGENLPKGIEGFHFHTLCESTSYELEKTFEIVEQKFGSFFADLKWLNMGGGHLMNSKEYDREHLIKLLQNIHSKYPHLELILEPGSAFTWKTGVLVTQIEDIVSNQNVQTAIINASFACHMPDCLEMPYKPTIIGGSEPIEGKPSYRIGGNSCLSGDFIGDWSFEKPLQIGDRIVFEDMNHYTTVKTTFFNGISHPSIALRRLDGTIEILRTYNYEDYKTHNN